MKHEAQRACRVAAVIFCIVFLLHAVRIMQQADVVVGGWAVPMTLSWSALFLSLGLALWLWRSSKSSR